MEDEAELLAAWYASHPIIAACDTCGMGYIVLNAPEGVRCIDMHCGGRVWRLACPEPMPESKYRRAENRGRRIELLTGARASREEPTA